MFASWALGVLGGSSIGFTVLLGAISDRLGRRPVLAAIYAGRVLIFAGFFLIRDNPMAILTVAELGGITMAGTGSMTSALTADIYGRFSVSSVFGLIFLVHQTGSALGSWLAGALFETTGGYGAAFALACLFLAGAAIVALKIDRGARRIWRAAVVSARPSTVAASSRNPRSMSRSARETLAAAPCHAGVPGAVSGRQRRQGRKPARSAAAAVGKKTTLRDRAGFTGQVGRQ